MFLKSRKKTKTICAAVAAMVMLLIAVGCSSEKEAGKSGKTKVMTVGTNMFGPTLDPHSDYDGWYVMRYGIGETLIRISDTMEAQPWLATKWELADPLTWKITIREGVKFHNGTAMTAEAVKNSLLRSAKVNKRGPSILDIASIDVKGQDLFIHTKNPRPNLIYELSDPFCTIVDTQAAEKDPVAFKKGAVCTGPFKVKEFKDNISATVEAFDGYWGERPRLNTVNFRNLSDPDTRMMALQSGEVDASINIDSKNLSLFKDEKKYTVSRHPSMRSTYLFFNTKNKFLKDKTLRKALIMSANKDSYIKTVMNGVGVKGICLYPSFLPYNNQALVTLPYDLPGAKKLLAENGYTDANGDGIVEKDGQPVELTISAYTSRAEIPGFATAVQADFSKLGIKTTIKTYDGLPRKQFSAGDYDIAFTGFSSTTNGRPLQGLTTAFVKDAIENYYNYFYNEKVEKIAGQLAVEPNIEKQNELAFEAQQVILDEYTNIFLCSTENLYVSSSKVKNFKAHPLDYYVLDSQVDIEGK